MPKLRVLTAGESHGPSLLAVIEGLPAGIPVDAGVIDAQLKKRQGGYGRGGRMDIEKDSVMIQSGVRFGYTLGSPIALGIRNRDWENWEKAMASGTMEPDGYKRVTAARPGHADLTGGMKYNTKDLRNILERASARETAARVAAGAVFGMFLSKFGVRITGVVEEIGGLGCRVPEKLDDEILRDIEKSPFRCADPSREECLRALIDETREKGDTVGGIFQVRVSGLVPGLGGFSQWDRRMDGRLAGAFLSIPGVKGFEIGIGFKGSGLMGTAYHDEIISAVLDDRHPWKYGRSGNNAGGLEGGMTTGEELVMRAVMKPIPTTMRGLMTVDVITGEAVKSHKERSDVCAVPAAAVVGEAMAAYVLADEYLIKFGGDTLEASLSSYDKYIRGLREY